MSSPQGAPNPGLIFKTLNAYQETYALKGAVELDLFTHIADGATTAKAIAESAKASERGIRILCDFLTVNGFLTKSGDTYGLTPTAAAFLSKRSPHYLGSMAMFLAHDHLIQHFTDMGAVVRKGGSLGKATLEPENPIWVEFARSMAPFISIGAGIAAQKIGAASKILDISAGHGLFGISVAKLNPLALVYGLDWANVLEVAKENAAKAGLGDRFHTIPGSAFDVDFGSGYDLVMLPNFLHHFDIPTCIMLLKKARASMAPGGRVATIEFVPNPDRVSPPMAASFSLQMLGGTPAGDAYTFDELAGMCREAGFGESVAISLEPTPQTLVLTKY
jgi:2-polyprenyl-3-methyl-5-hydroxy-6-metoxy-1,4-benzoquinol methylase